MVGSSFSENSFLTRRRTRQVFPVLISPSRTILRPFSPPPDLSPPPPPPRTGFFCGALLKQLPILKQASGLTKHCVTHTHALLLSFSVSRTLKHSCSETQGCQKRKKKGSITPIALFSFLTKTKSGFLGGYKGDWRTDNVMGTEKAKKKGVSE